MSKLTDGLLGVAVLLGHLFLAVVGLALSLLVTALTLALILALFIWLARWLFS